MIAQVNEAQTGGAAVGFEGMAQAVSDHCAPDDASAKAKATLTAQLALRGFCLSELSDGSFLVHRWNLSRPLADLRAAAVFARQVAA